MQTKPNLWPIGILLIILLGIVLISVSIRISSIQSIAPDSTFNAKKLFVDTNINELISTQNRFERIYDTYLGINKTPEAKDSYLIHSPYYVRPPAPKTKPSSDIKLALHNNKLTLRFTKRPADALLDEASLESASLEFVRLDSDSKDVKLVSVPLYKGALSEGDLVFHTDYFSLPLRGYYQARFEVSARFRGDSEDKKVFFYKWLFNGDIE